MTAKLPPFNPEATCPKCRHDKVNCQWHSKRLTPIGRTAPADEWISRRCERCGFIWDEACISVSP
jgi:DNA-directed RNA polymerase subunit M/transcription elongation factor TFIIS